VLQPAEKLHPASLRKNPCNSDVLVADPSAARDALNFRSSSSDLETINVLLGCGRNESMFGGSCQRTKFMRTERVIPYGFVIP
jgi:hypothetical protein